MWCAVLATTGTPGLHDTSAGVHVVDVTDPVALALAVEDDDAPLVVVSHASDAHAAAVAATFVVGHRPGRLVTHVSSRHAPLALLVALGTSLETTTDAGHGVAVWRDLLAASWSAVVLRSVTGLDEPNPPLVQHVRSWFPGSRFLVRLGPDPVSVRADRIATALGGGPVRSAGDLFVTDGGADDPVTRGLTSAMAPAGVRPVTLPGSWSSVFGRPEEMQVALLPSAQRGHVRPAGTACEGCGLATSSPVCDFCRTRTGLEQDEAPDEAHETTADHPDPTQPGDAAPAAPATVSPGGTA